MADLPPYLIAEEEFADFCRSRGLDETDEAWALFEQWVDGDLDAD